MTSIVSRATVLAIFTSACATDSASPGSSSDAAVGGSQPLTLERDIQPILDTYCIDCHIEGAGDPHGHPHFTADSSRSAFARMSDCTSAGTRVQLVTPGAPDTSFLLYKLGASTTLSVAGTDCDDMMPLRADAPLAELDPEAVTKIRAWILDGAR